MESVLKKNTSYHLTTPRFLFLPPPPPSFSHLPARNVWDETCRTQSSPREKMRLRRDRRGEEAASSSWGSLSRSRPGRLLKEKEWLKWVRATKVLYCTGGLQPSGLCVSVCVHACALTKANISHPLSITMVSSPQSERGSKETELPWAVFASGQAWPSHLWPSHGQLSLTRCTTHKKNQLWAAGFPELFMGSRVLQCSVSPHCFWIIQAGDFSPFLCSPSFQGWHSHWHIIILMATYFARIHGDFSHV